MKRRRPRKKASTPVLCFAFHHCQSQANAVCGMDMVEVKTDVGDDQTGAPTITLSKSAQMIAVIMTTPVVRRRIKASTRMAGKVVYDETKVAYIAARVPGRLDRLFVDYTGVTVKQGDHLADMYSPDLLTAQTQLFQELRAAKRLENGGSPEVLASSLRTIETIRDRLRLWGLPDDQIAEIERKGTPSDHLTMYAPIGGVVVDKHVFEGMYVETGMRIYTIADLSQVWVKCGEFRSSTKG